MGAPDLRLERAALAALALAAVLVARAVWPAPGAPDAACARPVSAAAHAGRTVAVRCGGAPGPEIEGPARLLFGQRLDPNTADAASLAVLPGIGAERAEAIVRERALAPFRRAEDLARAGGIGPATIERLRPWLHFAAEPGAAAAPVDPAEAGK